LIIDKKLASLLGIKEAIVLQQIHNWIRKYNFICTYYFI